MKTHVMRKNLVRQLKMEIGPISHKYHATNKVKVTLHGTLQIFTSNNIGGSYFHFLVAP